MALLSDDGLQCRPLIGFYSTVLLSPVSDESVS